MIKQKKSGSVVILIIVFVLVLLMIAAVAGSASFVGDRTGVQNPAGTTAGGAGTPVNNNQTAGGIGSCTFSVVSKDAPGSNIVSVSVPIWKYVSSGQKTSGTKSLSVHRNCAEAIKNIFTQIYNSSDQPPINTGDTGCYNYRGAGSVSRHNWGVACDINWVENYCICFKSGFHCSRAGSLCGPAGFWKPGDQDKSVYGWSTGKDLRSIPISSTIAGAFNSQKWGRGLYSYKNDFMHFSVDGD